MRELGESSREMHEGIVPLLRPAEAIFLVGPQMYQYVLPELKAS